MQIKLPRRLTFDPPLTDLEIMTISRDAKFRVEQTPEGAVVIYPKTSIALASPQIGMQFFQWWEEICHEKGSVFYHAVGIRLPDGSLRSANASYATEARMPKRAIPRDGFPSVCPNFVIELYGKPGSLAELQNKMESVWLANGVELGWLIDVEERTVFFYRKGKPVEQLLQPTEVSGEGPVAGFQLNLAKVWRKYEWQDDDEPCIEPKDG